MPSWIPETRLVAVWHWLVGYSGTGFFFFPSFFPICFIRKSRTRSFVCLPVSSLCTFPFRCDFPGFWGGGDKWRIFHLGWGEWLGSVGSRVSPHAGGTLKSNECCRSRVLGSVLWRWRAMTVLKRASGSHRGRWRGPGLESDCAVYNLALLFTSCMTCLDLPLPSLSWLICKMAGVTVCTSQM